MNIGVVSDTHGSIEGWKKALALWGDVDFIIHAGDILYHGPRNPLPGGFDPKELANAINRSKVPIMFARGNCDSEVDQTVLDWLIQNPSLFVHEQGLRILARHGHDVYPDELLEAGKRHRAKIIIMGHTHIPRLEEQDGIILLNPGSPTLPKNKDKLPTVAKIEHNRINIYRIDSGEIISSLGFVNMEGSDER